MGFWSGLFRRRPHEGLRLSLDEVEGFVKERLADKRKQLDRVIAGKFTEIKFVLGQMRASLEELKREPLEGENAKLQKIVRTARRQTIERLSALIGRLQPPVPSDLDAVMEYCRSGKSILEREIEQSGKGITYTSIYLRGSVKQLGQNVQELSKHLSFLSRQIEEFKAVFLEKALVQSLASIREKSGAIASLEGEIERANALLAKVEREKETISAKLSALRNSAAFVEITSMVERKSRLLGEKQSRKAELLSLLASIDKPLKRFYKVAESGRIPLPGGMRKTVRQLWENPLQLLKLDPKGENIKAVLLQLRKAIEDGLIELKEKERGKRLSAINELLAFNFFANVFWKLNQIDRQLRALEGEMAKRPIVGEISSLEKKLQDLEKSVQETGFSLAALKGRLEREREELSSLRQRTEELLQEICATSVYLK
jgi:peptidoglycan hydrolase CwlO-like protein